jgi:hypothetical protein
MTDWQRIVEHYANEAEAFATTKANRWAVDPYAWQFAAGITLSPIEDAIWFDIRAEGAVLYPQFPVGRFFVDFGNPAARVAIECDGKQWHPDTKRDAIRQRAIEAAGWTVYRITGSDCKKPDVYIDEDDDGNERVTLGPARALIREICAKHGIRV